MRIKCRNWVLAFMLMVLMVTGCGKSSKKSDTAKSYENAKVGQNLEVPPDLTAVAPDKAYSIPKASASPESPTIQPNFSTTSTAPALAGPQGVAAAVELKDTGQGVLPEFSKARIVRDGAIRWLVVDEAPEKLWKPVVNFWLHDGITLVIQNDKTGVIETQWFEYLENVDGTTKERSWAQKMFSRDQSKTNPEREKFRVRLERGENPNTTDIYVTHQSMVLTDGPSAVDLAGLDTRPDELKAAEWVPQPHSPEAEAEVLRLIMVYLGVEKQTATRVIASAPVLPPDRVRLVSGEQGAQQLEMDFEFERAWRRVGVALDRLGFTVENRNMKEGVYTIRTVEPGVVETKKDKDGFFRKMFSKEDKTPIEITNQVQVASANNLSTVKILDKDGKVDTSTNSGRILNLLKEQLR